MVDFLKLFVGALVQWALTTAFTRFAVLEGYSAVFLSVFIMQTIWWVNIHNTTRDGSWARWVAWCLGAATGAVLGKLLT